MSTNINGSDVQTLLNATHGLGFVEGNMFMGIHGIYFHLLTYLFRIVVVNVDEKCLLACQFIW